MFECFIGSCDRERYCEIMGQCVFTLSGVKNNPGIIEDLKWAKDAKSINKVLGRAMPDKRPVRERKQPHKKKKPGNPFRKAWVKYMQNKIA